MLDKYEKIKDTFLRDNELSEIVAAFEASNDDVCSFDRHVLHSDQEVFDDLNIPTRKLGVMLGLDLLRAWTGSSKNVESVSVSRPFLIIDGEWILGVKNASPPSVAICLQKSQDKMELGAFERAESRQIDFEMDIDFSDMEFRYSSNEYGEYTWMVRPVEPIE